MLHWLAIGLQAASSPVRPIDERLRAIRRCPAADATSGEVIVCGRYDDDQFRLQLLTWPAVMKKLNERPFASATA